MTLVATKGPDAFRTISEASDELGVPTHVLRFWETKFSFIRPMKRAGGRRFYRPRDLEVLKGVRDLLHEEGYTIKGVQRLHKEQGLKRLLLAGGATVETAAATEAYAEDDAADDDGEMSDLANPAAFAEFGGSARSDSMQDQPPRPERPMLADTARRRLEVIFGDLLAAKRAIDALLSPGANDVD